jgi:SAM-dependent methyltransferase
MKFLNRWSKKDSSYKDFWERMGSSPESALSMMDGSASEEACRLTGQYMASKISNALLLHRNDTVLELGCGIGRIGREIAPRCGKWFGADISRNMTEIARTRMTQLSNVGFTVLEKASLQAFPDESIDKAYSHAVFIHMDKEDLFLYLRELARVLKPGGLLYFDTWNLKNDVGWERWMMEVDVWSQSDQKSRKNVSRNQFSTPEEVSLYLGRSGLTELFCFPDSFWIQEIALKWDGTPPQKESTRESIVRNMDKIAVGPILTELFRLHLKLIKGQVSPEEFQRAIWSREESEDVSLYRNWFAALWQKNEKMWGPMPKSA